MLYRFAWNLCRMVLLAVRRLEVLGAHHIPPEGGLVLASNHVSYWDPVIVCCAFPKTRQVHFMAKAELFEIPLLGLFMKKVGAFPVRRGGADRSAIRTALQHLQSGQVVGIFPEGTRNKSEGMLEPHLGAAMLALRTGSPVLPAAVIGSRGFLGKVKIIFGPPLRFSPEDAAGKPKRAGRSDLTEISRLIMERVGDLMTIPKSGGFN